MRDQSESKENSGAPLAEPLVGESTVLLGTSLGYLDPVVGESLECAPEDLRNGAQPIEYGSRLISGLTDDQAVCFAEAIQNA